MVVRVASQMKMFDRVSDPVVLTHLEIASQTAGQGAKSLNNTSTGKFYTPAEIGVALAKGVSRLLSQKENAHVRVIDPFAGDGRLIVWLIENLPDKILALDVVLWDYDGDAIAMGANNVREAARKAGLQVSIVAERRNSFDKSNLGEHLGSFDAVITNPPWEVVKPDKHELQVLGSTAKESYVRSLKDFSRYLFKNYPLSKPGVMYAGWGVNLARTGTELSLELAKQDGIVAVVSPATLLADQNSYQLRRHLFESNSCESISVYPAEMRLFKAVDQPSISFILTKTGNPTDIKVVWHTKTESKELVIPQNFLKENDFIVPVHFSINPIQARVLSKLRPMKKISDLEHDPEFGLWTGRELDETGFHSWVSASGKVRFIKGVSIDRYRLLEDAPLFLLSSAEKRLPDTTNQERIGWRDVTRPSQKRRVIATILPSGCVTGNSVGVAKLRPGVKDGAKKLRALLAVMSSCVFEFQARLMLATAHMSQGVVRKISIPDLTDKGFVTKASDLAERIRSGDSSAEAKLEALVARAYKLNEEEVSAILEAFHKMTYAEKNDIIMKMR